MVEVDPAWASSTLARRYVADHPGTLNCDVDVLRSLIGGWQDDFVGAGALIRPAALAMIEEYLGTGQDVVVPQMLIRPTELARFEGAATAAGADFVERFVMADRGDLVARFHRRGGDGDPDPWHRQVREIVAGQGGDEHLLRCHDALVQLLADRPRARVIPSREGAVDETYRSLVESLG